MLNQKLQLKLSQKLSPQQIQLMKLIQLSTLEFEQRLSREIEENPALDTVNESQEIDNDNFEVVEVGATKEAKEIWSTDIKKRLVMLSKTLVSKQTAPTNPSSDNCRFCPWNQRCSVAIDPEEELVDIFANLGV